MTLFNIKEFVDNNFSRPTPECYWHYVAKSVRKPTAFTKEKIAAAIANIEKATNKPNSFTAKSLRLLTPLHIAAITGNMVAFEFFKSQNLPLDAVDEDGNTPIDYAKKFLETPSAVTEPSRIPANCEPIAKLFRERHVTLEKVQFKSTHHNDFGIRIIKLLFVKPSSASQITCDENSIIDHLAKNILTVAGIEGIAVRFSTNQYFTRDHWIPHPTGMLLMPHPSHHIKESVARSNSLAFIRQEKTLCMTDHVCLKGSIGASIGNAPLAIFDYEKLLKTETVPFLKFYTEGGNQFVVSNKEGTRKFLLGADLVHLALNQCLLDGVFTSPMFNLPKISSKIASTLSAKEILFTLEEMYAQGLFKAPNDDSKGYLSETDLSQVLKTGSSISRPDGFPLFTVLLEAAKFLNLYTPLKLREEEIEDARHLAATYLAQKQVLFDLFAASFNVKVEDVVVIPQADYHLDVFMRPGPNGSMFFQDYAFCEELLLTIKSRASELQLTSSDLVYLDRYLKTASKLKGELAPLFDKAKEALKKAGFTVLPMPGLFYDVSALTISPNDLKNAETFNLNFINSITGYSSQTGQHYYIAFGASVGDKLGAVIMDTIRQYLESYVPGIHVHFIGNDPENPSDFSEGMQMLNRIGSQAGPHCLSVEFEIEPN